MKADLSSEKEYSTMKTFGWIRDLPDVRDYHLSHIKVLPILARMNLRAPSVSTRVDLRPYQSPVGNQGPIGSCVSWARKGLIESCQLRAYGKYMPDSALWSYKMGRNLLGLTGDSGSTLRSAMQSLKMLGSAPEQYWPYDISKFEDDPPSWVSNLAENYKSIAYWRVDYAGDMRYPLLDWVKAFLDRSQPMMFGWTVFQDYGLGNITGKIPYPNGPMEFVVGGHGTLAVGYDDGLVIDYSQYGYKPTTGAVLFKNSWDVTWGEAGYGWLPYDYITNGLTADWWTLQSMNWLDTGQFS